MVMHRIASPCLRHILDFYEKAKAHVKQYTTKLQNSGPFLANIQDMCSGQKCARLAKGSQKICLHFYNKNRNGSTVNCLTFETKFSKERKRIAHTNEYQTEK